MRSRVPLVVPAGWEVREMPTAPSNTMMRRQYPSGMIVTFGIETYTSVDDHPPLGIPGSWRRLAISMPHRYPSWNEQRDYIRTCGLFDRTRDVAMLIPPDEDYVNLAKNAFHWWQLDSAGRAGDGV